jgi:DNA replication and repair protein RecF
LGDASEPCPGRRFVVLNHLSLKNFRNLGTQDLEFPPDGVAVVGDNAHGKSNLLEAIYYLETFRSFRGARDDQLIQFGEPFFRIAAGLSHGPGGDEAEVTAAFQRQGKRKRVTVDGVEPERLGSGLGRVGAILFSPADVALVSEGPAERRRFLDILLSLNEPGYLASLQRFRHVLNQRNAALRDGAPVALIRIWDGPLVESGVAVTLARREWVAKRAEAFGRYYREVSGRDGATMVHRASVPLGEEPPLPDDDANADAPGRGGEDAAAQLRRGYQNALEEGVDRDRRMGTTSVGPQRDELVIRLEGGARDLDVREYGSGGQRRTAALALRLVEADTVREARGSAPLILLDDVFAELDEGRSRRILEFIEGPGAGQVILTAPRESDVKVRRDSLCRWGIRDGILLR